MQLPPRGQNRDPLVAGGRPGGSPSWPSRFATRVAPYRQVGAVGSPSVPPSGHVLPHEVGSEGGMDDSLPDLGSLSDNELVRLADGLVKAEHEVSSQRHILHGKIDILRAELGNKNALTKEPNAFRLFDCNGLQRHDRPLTLHGEARQHRVRACSQVARRPDPGFAARSTGEWEP